MVRRYLTLVALVPLLAAATAASTTVVQHVDRGSWHATVEKRLVGRGYGHGFYQWSITARSSGVSYRSPDNGGPLDRVTKADGAPMWFPSQSARIAGVARLMNASGDELVVASHQAGADCGSATVTVFRYDRRSKKIVPAVSLSNGCELRVAIQHGNNGRDVLKLSGPYYNATAPMCCPTKPNASATLEYVNGSWRERPNYYRFYPNEFPHP